MEVVCLILGPALTSQPCSQAFGVLTSLHLSPFLLKMFSLFLLQNYDYVHILGKVGKVHLNLWSYVRNEGSYMFFFMLLLSRLVIKTALCFILTTVSTHHLTQKWDRSIKQHNLNILKILTACLDNTNFDVQILILVLQMLMFWLIWTKTWLTFL